MQLRAKHHGYAKIQTFPTLHNKSCDAENDINVAYFPETWSTSFAHIAFSITLAARPVGHIIVLFNDIQPRAGGTFIAPDGIAKVCKWYAATFIYMKNVIEILLKVV